MVKEMKGYNFLIARKLDNFLNLLSLIKLQKKSFNKVLLNWFIYNKVKIILSNFLEISRLTYWT